MPSCNRRRPAGARPSSRRCSRIARTCARGGAAQGALPAPQDASTTIFPMSASPSATCSTPVLGDLRDAGGRAVMDNGHHDRRGGGAGPLHRHPDRHRPVPLSSTSQRSFCWRPKLVARGARPAQAGATSSTSASPSANCVCCSTISGRCSWNAAAAFASARCPHGIFERRPAARPRTPRAWWTTPDPSRGGGRGANRGARRTACMKASLRATSVGLPHGYGRRQFNGGGHACAAGLNLKNGRDFWRSFRRNCPADCLSGCAEVDAARP
jgi:hypothetical protein